MKKKSIDPQSEIGMLWYKLKKSQNFKFYWAKTFWVGRNLWGRSGYGKQTIV